MRVLLLGKNVDEYEKVLKYLNVEFETGLDLNPNDFDKLIVPGGIDIDPTFYNQENIECQEVDKDLDVKQLSVIDHFVKHKKPILGICRGHQLLNVYFSGDLIQDLKTKRIHYQLKEDVDEIHDILASDWLEKLYGKTIGVNSSHHQAVGKLGKDLIVCAKAEEGVIEAIRHNTLPIIGVQFHPERMCLSFESSAYVNGLKIFEYFLAS